MLPQHQHRILRCPQKHYFRHAFLHQTVSFLAHLVSDPLHSFDNVGICRLMEALKGCRGKRLPQDLLIISGFVRSYIPQVCSFLSNNDLQDLYNEIGWITISDNEVLFLQNERADNYYIIGRGSVNLYYEEDDSANTSLSLGTYVGQLLRGQGFGEYALLANNLAQSELQQTAKRSKTGKSKAKKENSVQPASRSCSVVSGSNDTLLFVINETTYNRIFKKHHHLQRQRAHCIHFLRKLSIFRHASLAKVTQVTFKSIKTKLPFKTILGEYNTAINTVSIVMQGAVKVSARVEATTDSLVLLDDAFHLDQASICSSIVGLDLVGSIASVSVTSVGPPRPSVAVLRPGQIVGSVELLKGLPEFKFNYEVQSLSAEVLQIPAELYLQCAREAALNDPECANMTILRHPASEFSVASHDGPESKGPETYAVMSGVSTAEHTLLTREDSVTLDAVPLSDQDASLVLTTAPTAQTATSLHTPAAAPVTASTPSSDFTSTPLKLTPQTAPAGSSSVKAAKAMHSLLASPPSGSRPSKIQYRTSKVPLARSALPQNTPTTTKLLPFAGRTYSPASSSVLFAPSFVPVFSPAPPVSHSSSHPNTTTATVSSPRRLGAGYVDIVDSLEGRYPSTLSGPCGGVGYLSSPAEAARAVSREMQAIRQRVHAKQKVQRAVQFDGI